MATVVLGEHGVVEIARVLAVDRDQRNAAQIDAPLAGLRRHLRRQPFDLVAHLLRPDMGNVVRADGDLDFHAGRHVIAEHLDHAARRARGDAWAAT